MRLDITYCIYVIDCSVITGFMNRASAELKLLSSKNGAFLLRMSEHNQASLDKAATMCGFVVSLKNNNKGTFTGYLID